MFMLCGFDGLSYQLLRNCCECVAAVQPCFVWIFVYVSVSQHLLLFIIIIYLFFLGLD